MKRIFKSLFAFMFMVSCGLVLTACGTKDFDATKIQLGETLFTYDGYTHVCEVDYEVADVQVSVTYSETLDGQFKPAEDLTFINAGTYSVYYKLSAIGFNDYVSSEAINFTVEPKNVALNVEDVAIVRSNMGNTTPSINPTYTTPGVLTGDELGLTFGIGNKVGVGTPFDATNAVVGDEYYIEATSTNSNYKISLEDSKVKIIDAVEYVKADGSVAYSSNLGTAFSLAKSGTTLKLHSDMVLLSSVHITSGVYTIDLNGYTVSFPTDESGDGIFLVENSGSKLTIEDSVGTGIVNSASQNNDYSMAVWANKGGEVVIKGGTFLNVGARAYEVDPETGDPILTKPNNNELIYASREGIITIEGGTFVGNYENDIYGGDDTTGYVRFTLNVKDEKLSTPEVESGTIVVKGGEFRQYDPADSRSENPAGDFVANGYVSTSVTRDGSVWYVVTAAQA